ncbi:MAG TPA: DUF6789 family protein [Halococcus sp.]|nr:DUF6789 family protein [Halococcus sp.]
MSQETRSETATTTTGLNDWQSGVVGGLVGGVVMGALISLMNPKTIAVAIPALYGLAPPPNGIAGWIAHMSHSAIFGVIFAAIAAGSGIDRSVFRSAIAGLVWGFVLWVVAANIVMPIWLNAVGFPAGPTLLGFALPGSLIPHLVYGVLLGIVYPLVGGR